jgi:hypothetical protein
VINGGLFKVEVGILLPCPNSLGSCFIKLSINQVDC